MKFKVLKKCTTGILKKKKTRLACKICGAVISRKGDMAPHIALMHRYANNVANDKLFTCPCEPCVRTKQHYIKTT